MNNKLGRNWDIIGVNYVLKKEIEVYLSGNKEEDLEVIQHELCHSFVVNVQEEDICDDLARMGVCLEK